jgi:hypothetical protein
MLYPCGGSPDRLNELDICAEQTFARNPLATNRILGTAAITG